MNVAVDVTALAQTRAGTARYLHALLPRLERDVSLRRVSGYARGAPGTLWLDLAWYPHVLSHKARGADVLHCPTYRGPVRDGATIFLRGVSWTGLQRAVDPLQREGCASPPHVPGCAAREGSI